MVAYVQEIYVCVVGGLSVGNVRGNAGNAHIHTEHVYCGLVSALTGRDQVTQ